MEWYVKLLIGWVILTVMIVIFCREGTRKDKP